MILPTSYKDSTFHERGCKYDIFFSRGSNQRVLISMPRLGIIGSRIGAEFIFSPVANVTWSSMRPTLKGLGGCKTDYMEKKKRLTCIFQR